jgi:hypothetical protein
MDVLEALHPKIFGFGIVIFGLPGSLNNINVLHRSHLLARRAKGDAPACNYTSMGESTQWDTTLPMVYTQIGPHL